MKREKVKMKSEKVGGAVKGEEGIVAVAAAVVPVSDTEIQSRITTVRGMQVMLDRDIAAFYGVEPRVLNQAVKRNPERFPERFMHQLTKEEFENLKSQSVISSLIHNTLTVRLSDRFHDRYLIIDNATLIHVGASLNCLGKRCFAFSTLDAEFIPDILART